jgi:hypothetical protein
MLRITRDLPGKQLALETTEKPYPSLTERMGCFAVLLLMLAVAGAIGYLFYDTHAELVLALSVMLGLLVILVIGTVVFPQKEILTVHVDGDKRQLDIALGLPGYEPSRHRVAAFKEIEAVRLVVPQGIVRDGSQDIPFELWVHSSTRKWKEKFTVSGVNTDVELSDFLLRLANIVQLPYYRIVVNDPQNFELCSTRVAEKRSKPVPDILEVANYTKEIVAASVTPPPPQVAVDVEGEDALPPTVKALVWAPGQQVELVKRWRIFDFLMLGGALLALAGAAILWMRPELINTLLQPHEEQAMFITSLLFPVFSGGVAFAGWILSSLRYRCRLDFNTGQATVRLRGGWKPFKLAEVQEIVLVRERHGSSNPRTNRRTTYKHRLEATLHNGDSYRLMLDRRSSSLDQCEQHYNELWPFTAALAALLNVPARYGEKT